MRATPKRSKFQERDFMLFKKKNKLNQLNPKLPSARGSAGKSEPKTGSPPVETTFVPRSPAEQEITLGNLKVFKMP